MKLLKLLDVVNQIEKSSFLKILDSCCNEVKKTDNKLCTQIDKILSEGEGQLKNVDNQNIVNLFNLLDDSYAKHLNEKIKYSDIQLDILIDILVKDGNSMMSREWFQRLYEKEIKKLQNNIKSFSAALKDEKSDLDPSRKRDYLIYQNCLKTGYENDLERNRDKTLSWEEKTILHTLANNLELSNEEIRWITYTITPLKKFTIDEIIGELKESGIIFYSRRTNTIFVPDEIVWLLRKIVGFQIPTKYLRRILRHLSNGELLLISRKHNIDRKLTRNDKIHEILDQGLRVTNLLNNDIFKEDILKSDRAARILLLIEKDLEIQLTKWGRSLEERVANLIEYFNNLDRDETTSLSKDGYSTLLKDIEKACPQLNERVKSDFELEPEKVLRYEILDDYNIKPTDVIYLLTKDEIRDFCKACGAKTRGNVVSNIIDNYRNIEDLYIENFDLIGSRDLISLNEIGLSVKESELGILYEEVTKNMLKDLGFNVDEKLRKQINTNRLHLDILLNLGNQGVIIIECKTIKDRDYNKYTSVSRQLKSYQRLCQDKGYNVAQVVLISHDFTEDFISECEYDYEMSLSLITSNGLKKILEGFKNSRLTEFPVRLLQKDGLLNEDRIVKVLSK